MKNSIHTSLRSLTFSLLIFGLVGCGGSGGSGGDGTTPDPGDGSTQSQESTFTYTQTVSPDALDVTHENVSLAFSPVDINTSRTLTIRKRDGDLVGEDAEDAVKTLVYDFDLEGQHRFTEAVKIAIQYTEPWEDGAEDEAGQIVVKYYHPQTESWDSVDYAVNTETNTITLYTDHLSTYVAFFLAKGKQHGAFKTIYDGTSIARITAVDPFVYHLTSRAEATRILRQSIQNGFVPDDGAYTAAFNKANEWLGLMGAGNGLATAPLSGPIIKGLSSSFNGIGALASVLQVAFDIANGDEMGFYTNATKNLTYNAVNFLGTSALQLAFVGVFAIDYSLNAFASEALSQREEKWKKAYEVCYTHYHKKSAVEWFHLFEHYAKTIANPSRLDDVIYNLLYNNAWDGWDEEHMAGCIDDAGYAGYDALGGELSTSEKQAVVDAKISELVAALQDPVFDRLTRVMRQRIRATYRQQLDDLKKKLNQKILFKIGTPNANAAPNQYANYVFQFAPLREGVDPKKWRATLHEDGTFSTSVTLLGYLQAGAPTSIKLYKPSKSTPVKTIPFGPITLPETSIPFSGESNLSGDRTFSGTATSEPYLCKSDLGWEIEGCSVTMEAAWRFAANTEITLKPHSASKDLALKFETAAWSREKDPTGTFEVQLSHDFKAGSTYDVGRHGQCTAGQPRLRFDQGDTWDGYVSTTKEIKFDYRLDGDTLSGSYYFPVGGCGGFAQYTLVIPMSCTDGESFNIRANKVYFRLN